MRGQPHLPCGTLPGHLFVVAGPVLAALVDPMCLGPQNKGQSCRSRHLCSLSPRAEARRGLIAAVVVLGHPEPAGRKRGVWSRGEASSTDGC